MSVGKRLQIALQFKDVKTKDLVNTFNITQQYVSNIKKAEKINDTIANIANHYHINLNWLISGDGQMFINNTGQTNHIHNSSASRGSSIIDNSSDKTIVDLGTDNTFDFKFPHYIIDELNTLFVRVRDEIQKDKLLEAFDYFVNEQKKNLR